MIQFVKRRHRNMVSLGDVIVRDGHRERIVEMTAPGFVLTVPERRKDVALGTFTVFWRDLA